MASMISACFNEAAGIPRGRHADADLTALTGEIASMRPRVFPAEDGHGVRHGHHGGVASMRPRVFPAEDAPPPPPPVAHAWLQ